MQCPKCGSLNYDGYQCYAHFTCAEFYKQQAELTKYKLKWQTGKPPVEGQGKMFYVKHLEGKCEEVCFAVLEGDYYMPTYNEYASWHYEYDVLAWAGPIEPPE